MITIFTLSGTPLQQEQQEYLNQLLYRYSLQNDWLTRIPYNSVTMLWCPQMTIQNGVLGAYNNFNNTLYLQKIGIDSKFCIQNMFPTVVHQLKHYQQYRNNKLLYLLCLVPGIRQLTIQKEADKETLKAQEFIRCHNWCKSYLRVS